MAILINLSLADNRYLSGGCFFVGPYSNSGSDDSFRPKLDRNRFYPYSNFGICQSCVNLAPFLLFRSRPYRHWPLANFSQVVCLLCDTGDFNIASAGSWHDAYFSRRLDLFSFDKRNPVAAYCYWPWRDGGRYNYRLELFSPRLPQRTDYRFV